MLRCFLEMHVQIASAGYAAPSDEYIFLSGLSSLVTHTGGYSSELIFNTPPIHPQPLPLVSNKVKPTPPDGDQLDLVVVGKHY